MSKLPEQQKLLNRIPKAPYRSRLREIENFLVRYAYTLDELKFLEQEVNELLTKKEAENGRQ